MIEAGPLEGQRCRLNLEELGGAGGPDCFQAASGNLPVACLGFRTTWLLLRERIEGSMTSPGTWVRLSPAAGLEARMGPSWGYTA